MYRKLILAAALAVAVGQPALAQQKAAPAAPAAKSPGLAELDCRTLLRLGGDERAFTLLYFHGFVSGRMNQTDLPTDVMASATDKIVDHCIDKPADKLLTVFEQVRKQAR
ncbi:MAG: HdeA family protein [Burkholderiaceae bacterium]|jgi:hypothetical protein|nr:HdeA family protein [Burkholderiaceae bacterium]